MSVHLPVLVVLPLLHGLETPASWAASFIIIIIIIFYLFPLLFKKRKKQRELERRNRKNRGQQKRKSREEKNVVMLEQNQTKGLGQTPWTSNKKFSRKSLGWEKLIIYYSVYCEPLLCWPTSEVLSTVTWLFAPQNKAETMHL